MTLAPGSTGNVQKLVLQVGANDPMEMPVEGAQAHQFAKPDPKTLVKEETIKVAAGSYKTKHYHDKTPAGRHRRLTGSPRASRRSAWSRSR